MAVVVVVVVVVRVGVEAAKGLIGVWPGMVAFFGTVTIHLSSSLVVVAL